LGKQQARLPNQQAQSLIAAGTGAGNLQRVQIKICAQLAGTAAQAQNAANANKIQQVEVAGGLAAQQAAARQAAGLGMGTLATQGNAMNLACINALRH